MKTVLFIFVAIINGFAFGQTIVGDISHDFTNTNIHQPTGCYAIFDLQHDIIISNSFIGDSVKIIKNGGSILQEEENTSGISTWNITQNFIDDLEYTDLILQNDSLIGWLGSDIYKIISGPDTMIFQDTGVGDFYVEEEVIGACNYELASGRIYVDNNANCEYEQLIDDGVYGFLGQLEVLNYSAWMYNTYSQNGPFTSGYWEGKIFSNYLVDATYTLPGYVQFAYTTTGCGPLSYTITSVPEDSLDFVLKCMALDVDVHLEPLTNVHAVLPFELYPAVTNFGCDPFDDTLFLVLDPNVSYNPGGSSNPADIVSGDTLKWVYTGLNNLQSGTAYWNVFTGGIELQPNGTVGIGDTLCFEIWTGIPINDVNPLNNYENICFPVVAAYDPNVKNVLPKGTGPEGFVSVNTPSLEYTIKFQNTGTAQAINVHIIDTLESNLIPSSIQMLSNSHNMTPEWLDTNVVQFNFQWINLPDSTSNEPESHGFVKFKIGMKQNLAEGTEVRNRGHIYFDNNQAVITPDALNTIQIGLSIDEDFVDEIGLFPNPTDGLFYLNADQNIEYMEVLNLNGKVVITTTESSADVSGLPNGLYLVKIYSDKNVSVKKLVKQ